MSNPVDREDLARRINLLIGSLGRLAETGGNTEAAAGLADARAKIAAAESKEDETP